jgi:hypothetical protein
VRCHLIGATTEIHEYLAGRPDVIMHTGLEAAWREWE